MKNTISKRIIAVAAVQAAFALAACTTPVTVSFESPHPWQTEGMNAYEKFEYAVALYNTENGSGFDTRVAIAEGKYTLELNENFRTENGIKYSSLKSDFFITYNSQAPEADRGLTDTVQSFTVFQTDSLATDTMEKTVTLAPRKDEETNLSYRVTAEYFDAHTATRLMTGKPDAKEETMSVPVGTFYDNELMFYLARATALADSSSPNFYLTNIFDSFVKNEFTTYTMYAECSSETSLEFGDWIKEFAIRKNEDGTEEALSVIPCYNVSIKINSPKRGQPTVVYYSKIPFRGANSEHKKVPVFMANDEYTGSKPTRRTEYTLTSCAFEKAE